MKRIILTLAAAFAAFSLFAQNDKADNILGVYNAGAGKDELDFPGMAGILHGLQQHPGPFDGGKTTNQDNTERASLIWLGHYRLFGDIDAVGNHVQAGFEAVPF